MTNKKERGCRETAAASSSQAAVPASHELRETPIELDWNPTRRLHMKLATSAASGSGHQPHNPGAAARGHQTHNAHVLSPASTVVVRPL